MLQICAYSFHNTQQEDTFKHQKLSFLSTVSANSDFEDICSLIEMTKG